MCRSPATSIEGECLNFGMQGHNTVKRRCNNCAERGTCTGLCESMSQYLISTTRQERSVRAIPLGHFVDFITDTGHEGIFRGRLESDIYGSNGWRETKNPRLD